MIHAFQLLFNDCNYPKAFVWWIGLHAVMFYFLFSNFYKETYNKKKAKAEVGNIYKYYDYINVIIIILLSSPGYKNNF